MVYIHKSLKQINTSSSGIHKRLANSNSCTEYDKNYGPHYRAYFHTEDFGDNLMSAHFYKPTIFESEVRIAGYRISIGLKVVCIWQNSNLEEGGGCIMDAWQVYLGLHTIFLRDGLYCGPHYTSAHPL